MRVKIGGDYKDISSKELREKGVSYVYMIKNLENNRVYIGESVDPVARFCHHKYNKDWVNNNSCELIILEETTLEQSIERERFYIKKYNAIQDGYNQKLNISIDGKKHIDKSKKLTQKEADELRKDYEKGIKFQNILSKYDISGFTVDRILNGESYINSEYAKNYIRNKRTFYLTDTNADEIRIKYLSGVKISELAKFYDVTVPTISEVLNYNSHKNTNINIDIDCSVAELCKDEANNIRKYYNSNNISIQSLSEIFQITYKVAYNIITNKVHFNPNYQYDKKRVDMNYSEETINEIKNIRKMYKTGEYTYNELAGIFNRSSGSIGEIIRRESYNSIN